MLRGRELLPGSHGRAGLKWFQEASEPFETALRPFDRPTLSGRSAPDASVARIDHRKERDMTDRVHSPAEIAAKLQSLPGWELKDGMIRRKYKTGGWAHSLMLTNTIAFLAEAAWHHPDIRTSYLEVTVMLKTHSADGITDKDFELAAHLDSVVLWQPPQGHALEGYVRGLKGKKDWVK